MYDWIIRSKDLAETLSYWATAGGIFIAVVAGGKLRKHRQLTARELPLLKQEAAGEFKVTIPAPSNFIITSYKPGITDIVYRTREDFLADLVEIIRDEICSEQAYG